MHDPIITLSSDFGANSPYVAAMKGVILDINPLARLIDLTHEIPAHDLRYTSLFLCSCLPYYPREALHVVVVDPGVGTDRSLLYVETDHYRLLVPDNGCWTELATRSGRRPLVIKLTENRFWRAEVSPTFHGRDILAPVAGRLSMGLDCRELGTITVNWAIVTLPKPQFDGKNILGEVLFADRFGNLITNLHQDQIIAGFDACLLIGTVNISRRVRTYGDAVAGTDVFLVGSTGHIEVAVVQGNAATKFNARAGTPVKLIVRSENGK